MPDEMTEYDALVSQIGGTAQAAPAQQDEIGRARAFVSEAYQGFIRKYGYAVFANGSFQLVNPSRFAPVLAEIFRNDRQFNAEQMCAVGMSAFGDLLVCQRDFGLVDVVFAQHWISVNEFAADYSQQIDQNLRSAIFAKAEDSDNYDEAGEPLFDRCRAKLGILRPGQIYAPILPPSAGGSLDIANYKIAEASTAVALNAQWDGFRLMDFSNLAGPRFVRTIGQ